MVKKMPVNAADRDSVPGSGRSPGEENGYPLQYACLGNPMDRGAWRATVHGVTQSRTQLKRLSISISSHRRAKFTGSIPGSGSSPGERNGYPLQYSCLENPLDREASWTPAHGIARVGHDLPPEPPPPRRCVMRNSLTSSLQSSAWHIAGAQ